MFFQRTRSFFYGLLLPLDAAKLIAGRKSLLLWSVFPVILTIVLYVYVIGTMQDHVLRLLQDWISSLGWDPEGPEDDGAWRGYFRQTSRLEVYRAHAERLLAEGRAYRCYCPPEELLLLTAHDAAPIMAQASAPRKVT